MNKRMIVGFIVMTLLVWIGIGIFIEVIYPKLKSEAIDIIHNRK